MAIQVVYLLRRIPPEVDLACLAGLARYSRRAYGHNLRLEVRRMLRLLVLAVYQEQAMATSGPWTADAKTTIPVWVWMIRGFKEVFL